MVKRLASQFIIALILSFILQNYIAQAVTIPSESMIPTLNINDN